MRYIIENICYYFYISYMKGAENMQRIEIKKSVFIFMCIAGLCIGSIFGIQAEASTGNGKEGRVLFISSYSYAWETVPEQIEGIKEALPEDTVIDYKFMDTKNVDTEKSRQLFYESLEEYLKEVPPYHLIIAGDDAAFDFTVENQEHLLHDIPIVFEGVNNVEDAYAAKETGKITGVIESLSYKNTIQLATELYPEATDVVAILDDTITGKSERKMFYNMGKYFSDLRFSEINASLYTREEFVKKIEQLNDSTILLYIMCTEDSNRVAYSSMESIKLVSQKAKIPVFSIVSIGMGTGILGGELVSQRKMGYEAALMAKRILSGENVKNIPIMRNSPKYFKFDADVMKEYHILEKQLPKGTEIIHKEESFWEHNRGFVKWIFGIGFFLIILLGIMTFDNIRRRKLNGALERVKATLEEASRYDVMTALFNRRVFMEEADKRMKNNQEFGILLMDLDNFKRINDTLGHNNGDIVLKELASRLKVLEDENFRAYRLAGDEFTAIIDAANPDVVEAYAKEIQFSFRKPYILENKEYMLHSSIGIAMYPGNGETVSQLVASADAAMYKVKNHGKGGIAFYDESCDMEEYERKRSVQI